MAHSVKTDEARDPVAVGAFGPQAVMFSVVLHPAPDQAISLGLPATDGDGKNNSMTPLLSDCSQASKRIRRNNSVKRK